MVVSHSASINQLESQVGNISKQLNTRPRGGILSETIANPKNDVKVIATVTRSGRALEEPFRGDVSKNMNKTKAKEVTPLIRDINNEKEVNEREEEVVEVEGPQVEARPTIQVPSPFPQCFV